MKAAAAIQLRTGAARRLLLLLLLWSKSGSPMQTTELLHAYKDWPEKGEGGKPKRTQTAENWRSAAPLSLCYATPSSPPSPPLVKVRVTRADNSTQIRIGLRRET